MNNVKETKTISTIYGENLDYGMCEEEFGRPRERSF